MGDRPLRGMVLSGGGARGAYEAGVLAYIHEELPADVLAAGRMRVLCGTSVGAVHACFLASTAHMPRNNIGVMLQVWESLRLRDLLRLKPRDLLRLPWDLAALLKNTRIVDGLLLNSRVLQDLVMRDIAWPQIHRNMEAGLLDGVTVSTTHIASGKTVVFVDRPDGGIPSWTRDQRRIARAVRIGPQHALASAAIPVLFPAVSIDGAYYCDGGLRQNTPLSPALRLGADRVLVVAVGHGRESEVPVSQHPAGQEAYPGASLLIGKVLNALLLDHLDYDLAQLNGFNRLLADGQAAFGKDFVTQLSESAAHIRGASYRRVDTLVIRPSRDLGEMATEFVEEGGAGLEGAASWLLRKIAAEDAANNSDLLSYLCFDGNLAASFIALGKQDADAARDKLIAFFRD
jgi:NTE family protein